MLGQTLEELKFEGHNEFYANVKNQKGNRKCSVSGSSNMIMQDGSKVKRAWHECLFPQNQFPQMVERVTDCTKISTDLHMHTQLVLVSPKHTINTHTHTHSQITNKI